MLKIADVIEVLSDSRPIWGDRALTDAVIDSRKSIPGCLFFALPGERVNGFDYVSHAFERGAYVAIIEKSIDNFNVLDLRNYQSSQDLTRIELPFCILVENSLAALQKIACYWRRKLSPRVIGITGSVGKSTTKELVSDVLSQRFNTLKNEGNLNNEIGLPLTILHLDNKHEKAVLEMGFYVPGEIKFLCDIALPQIGVVTNIGLVHAERAGSQEDIARGKAELVRALPAAPEGVAILNIDDPFVRKLAELTSAQVFFYGMHSDADLWADHIEGLGLDGIRFRLHFHNEVLHLKVPLIGRHSVHTALRAAAVGLVEGLNWQEIVNGLRSQHTQLRLANVHTDTGALILDDTYNASPQSTMAALNLLDEFDGHKIAILGDMLELGRYERFGHEMIGSRASQVVDELITVGERARIIAEAAARSGLSPKVIKSFENCQEVIDDIKGRLGPTDIVLIKGSRGMNLDEIVSALEIIQ
jgi:UDP-N-acetylmuramoyl-tripeptide--D-alanyl-D-alanine ligase